MEQLVLLSGKEQHFFASANTAKGFVNYYDGIFFSVPRVWYIKGGPGTGKSYMMKRIASVAGEKGYTVVAYHCSSDPASLDGVLIPEIGFGILDGTAPHVGDPRYPGAGDRLIDVGQFWNERVLKEKREQIAELVAKKKNAYRMVYEGLAAEAALRNARRIALEPTLLQAKLRTVAERICRCGVQGRVWRGKACITDAIGMGGRTHFPTLEAVASRVHTVRDRYGAGEAFLAVLAETAARLGCEFVCSLDPLEPDRITAVLLAERGDLYTLQSAEGAEKEINTDRFLDQTALRSARAHLRRLLHAEETTRDATDAGFLQIRTIHFALEQMYAEAMDFAKQSAFLEKLVFEIFA